MLDPDDGLGRIADQVSAAAPSIGAVRLVVVDGPAGSGKTTVAAGLARLLDAAAVVHADELYEGWAVVAGSPDRVAAFEILGARVSHWLLDRWAAGVAGSHPVWDWASGDWSVEQRQVPPSDVIVLEGVGMAAGPLRTRAAVAVWVEHPDPAGRLRRVLQRDGARLEEHMRSWQRDEERWFATDDTAAGCREHLVT